MQDATEASPLERAGDAAATGDWKDAYERLIEVDARTPLTGAETRAPRLGPRGRGESWARRAGRPRWIPFGA
jgi:hypothetical protein